MAPKRGKAKVRAKAKAGERPKPPPCETGEILQAFNSADIDHDGTISRDDFATVISKLDPFFTLERANELFAAADVNEDEKIDFAEFINSLFSDFQVAEDQLCTIVGATATSDGLKKDDPDADDEFLCLPGMTLEVQFDNVRESALATFPDLAESVVQYLQEAKARLLSKEFEERIVDRFGTRMDKDGNGTLCFEEVKDLISESLQADADLWGMPAPNHATIRCFFDSYNTASFGREMGSQEFLNLMRGLNMHMISSLFPQHAKRWRISCQQHLSSEETFGNEFLSETKVGAEAASARGPAREPAPAPRPAPEVVATATKFHEIDTYADASPKSAESSIESLASYLCGEWSPCRDEKDKARSIFRWVAKNVRYDMDGLLGKKPKQSNEPKDVLKNRTSVCAGYAGLFHSLAAAAGLKCMKLNGACKGASFKQGAPYSSTHAWNAVQVNGQWALLDACWGAGSSTHDDTWSFSFNEAWFLPPPSFFSLRHFPAPGNERWQLLEEPYTYDEYMAIAAPTGNAFMWGIEAVSHPHACVKADGDGRLTMTFSSRCEMKLSATIKGGGTGFCDCDAEGNSRVRIAAVKGEHEMDIFGKPACEPGNLTGCFTYQLSSPSACKTGVPTSYVSWGLPGHSLREPIEGLLKPNKQQHFSLAAKGLANLKIILGDRSPWVPMIQQDDHSWAVDVKLPADGDVQIVAKASESETSYTTLLKYTIKRV